MYANIKKITHLCFLSNYGGLKIVIEDKNKLQKKMKLEKKKQCKTVFNETKSQAFL